MKKLIGVLAIAGMGVALTGCGNQNTQNNSSTAKNNSEVSSGQSTTTTNNSSNRSEMHHERSLWNNQKNEQLASFMQKWGPTMHQSYEQYDGQNELKVSTGITYPDGLSKELVEGQSGLIGWAPSGKGDYEYNVVAIYNHDGTEPPLPNRITYFFAFHNGKPVVLVDQSNNGDPDCHPTTNTDLESNFERIATESTK
ncbi:MAG: DUF4767 domain-containing protein [Lactobacillus sp.]|nr:DUF4767 domain-containing protein [Lactobacillus sp.]